MNALNSETIRARNTQFGRNITVYHTQSMFFLIWYATPTGATKRLFIAEVKAKNQLN